MKIFYNNVTSCVLNNGYASELFTLERGVRQGGPLSGLLFVIGIEVLANAIRNKNTIKGIKVRDKENTLKFVKNTLLRVEFSTLFSVFGYPDEILSLVFDILHH